MLLKPITGNSSLLYRFSISKKISRIDSLEKRKIPEIHCMNFGEGNLLFSLDLVITICLVFGILYVRRSLSNNSILWIMTQGFLARNESARTYPLVVVLSDFFLFSELSQQLLWQSIEGVKRYYPKQLKHIYHIRLRNMRNSHVSMGPGQE